jgi:predicted transcriptional regulator
VVAPSPPNVPDAEWAVLQVLWDGGPAPARRLAEALYPGGGASECATVYKLLERLEAKRLVARERDGGVYVFRATDDRETVVGRQMEALVERLGGGSLQPLLSNLVRAKRVTAEELRELLDLVDTLGRRPKPKRR